MADLGNLWFSLGLDDKKFEKEWKAAFNKYKNQANIDVSINVAKTDLSQLTNIQNKLNAFTKNFNGQTKAKIDVEITQRTLDSIKALKALGGTKAEWAAVREAAKAAGRYAREMEKANNANISGQGKIVSGYKTQSLWLQNLSTLASNYFSLYAVKNFVTELAQVSGEFEKQRVTIQAMVGEMEGLEIYGKMKQLAVVSPFEFKDLSSYAKQLAAFSVPYEELYDTTKRLADVSAGLGVDMSRIILAYGQIRSAGVLKGTELRQLTEAGVPILEKLAEKFEQLEGKAVSIGDVFGKISKKMVSFEMVKDIFADMTSEGGKFYNMQEIQAETLSGKISNLKDAYAIMLSEIGESSEGFLKYGVEKLYGLIDNWELLGRVIVTVFTAYGALQGVKIAYWIAGQLSQLKKLITKVRELRVEMGLLKALTKTGAWGAIALIFGSIAMGLVQAYSAATKFNREMYKITSEGKEKLENEISALDNLTNAIEKTTEGTENRRRAIEAYNNHFGQYLDNLYNEKTALDAIKNGNEAIRASMSERYKEEAIIKAKQKVQDEYGSELSTIEADYIKALKKVGLGGYSASAIAVIKDELTKNASASITDIQKAFYNIFKDTKIANNLGFRFEKFFSDYKDDFNAFTNAMKEALQDVDNAFDLSIYDSWKKDEEFKRITKEYNDALKNIGGLEPNEAAKQERQERIAYLTKLIALYSDMPRELKKYSDELNKLTTVEDKTWRNNIAKITSGFNNKDKGIIIPVVFNPKEDETWLAYVDRIKKEYKEIKDSIDNIGTDPDKELPTLQAQKDALEAIAKAYKLILDEKGDKRASEATLKKQREEVEKLKVQYNSLLAVYKAYMNLKNKTGDEGVAGRAVAEEFGDYKNEILAALEKDGGVENYLKKMFVKISGLALANGGEFGERFVEGMKSALSTMGTKDIVSAIDLGEDIRKELQKWGLEDFTLSGENGAFNISKILREQTISDNQAFYKRKEILDKIAKAEKGDIAEVAALKEMYGEDWLKNAKNRANELYKLETANNAKVAQDKIQKQAEIMAKDALKDAGFSEDFFTNLGEKTYSQLKDAMDKLSTLMKSFPDYTADQLAFFQNNGGGQKFLESFREFFGLLGKDVKITTFEKIKKDVIDAGKAASEMINAFKGLSGEDSILGGVLDGLGFGVDAATSILGAFEKKTTYDKEGNVLSTLTSINWASIAASAASMVTNVIQGVIAAKRYREEMQRAEDVFRRSVVESRRELKITGEEFDTIFGEDFIGALNADSDAISDIVRQLRNASKDVSSMKIMTRKGFWGIGRKYTTLKDLAPQLFKADGSVNYEYLDEFLDAYGDKMGESQKALLEHLKDSYKQYQDAMADTTDYLSSIFSDTASTIADRMIEAFATTGDAATGLGDLVHSVAKSMAKDLIQSLLIDQYLTPTIDRIKSLYDPTSSNFEEDALFRTQKAILLMQDAIQVATESVPEVNKLLEALQAMGIDLNTDAENASDVLSGLNEDQQNLLVSYINGIRADVSINKGLLTSIVNTVGTINNNIATAIVVWKQIEANTHRSADGVDRIIGFFESVMGPYDGGGGQALRVNVA